MSVIEIGRLLRAATTGFIAGCRVDQMDAPVFGALVRVPLDKDTQIYGLIYDIHIDDDGLVRQLVTSSAGDPDTFGQIIADNRVNRNVPLEISVLVVGYQQSGNPVSHLLPPKPPLSLDLIYLCDPEEIRKFTSAGRFGYFRHILRNKELPVSELLAVHIQYAAAAHAAAGNTQWKIAASKELITLLRDDYAGLMDVLNALGDVLE